MTSDIDYAEILRLGRKYRTHPKEPLSAIFIRIGRDLEAAKPKRERCPKCHRTDIEFKRVIVPNGFVSCTDPWHADDHLRADGA